MVLALEVYLGAGALVTAVFLLWGIGRRDPQARGSFAFRPLLIPGVVILWPLVLVAWARPARAHHRPPLRLQEGLALVLAVAIPVVLVTGLLVRQQGPLERPAVLLAPADADMEGATR